MSDLSPILRSAENGKVSFWCPGCNEAHTIRVNDTEGKRPNWTYNGNPEKPTFSPSLLVTYNGPDAGQADEDGFRAPPATCHLFVNDGQIQFLGDCTHALAGQTVPIPEWPKDPA